MGPVRSARLVDVDLLVPYHPVLAYSGARAEVQGALVDAGAIGLVSASAGAFRVDPERAPPHHLLAESDAVLASGATADGVEPASGGLEWGPLAGEGSVGTELSIRMSPSRVVSWEYDVEAGFYRRFVGGVPFTVAGQDRVGAANVVVVLTDVGPGGCCDGSGADFVTTRLDGGGDAVVLRDGRRLRVRWTTDGAGGHLRLVDDRGRDVPLAAGPTWIHLAPMDAVG